MRGPTTRDTWRFDGMHNLLLVGLILAAAFGLHQLHLGDTAHMGTFLTQHEPYLVAISLGSVCFGALTYIGNGPNLMVKAICDHAKVHTPHFFDYIWRFSLPVLIPTFIIVTLLFMR